jgi:hypothetical protein
MKDILYSLQLVDIDRFHLHEAFEPLRLNKTTESIKKDGFIRHPVIATRITQDRYLILDGVHRITALRQLGYNKVPAQIVNREDFTFGAWDHLIVEGNWLRDILADSSLQWCEESIESTTQLFEVVKANGNRNILNIDQSHDKWLHLWNEIVSSYSKNSEVIRIPEGCCTVPERGKVLIKYRVIAFSQLEKIVEKGLFLPAGVTRFNIKGRLLNLRIPLHLLRDDARDREEWKLLMGKWKQSLRLYTEQVYICEF